jgi:hypothetical protein
MDVLGHFHVHAALSPENKPAMCVSNGRLIGPHNLKVSKKRQKSRPCWECVHGSYVIHPITWSLCQLSYPDSYADKWKANRQTFVETKLFRTNGEGKKNHNS